MFRSSSIRVTAAVVSSAGIVVPTALRAQQSELSVSPFVTFMPTAGASPLAGLALTLAGNGGLALRASGHLSLENTNTATTFGNTPGTRPWGADADAVLFIGGRSIGGYQPRTIAPYIFAGLGVAGSDSLARSTITHNWSYGAGLTIPVAGAVDLFGESRWRMSRYVLPTAHYAPTPKNEFRVGISFHVGGGGNDSHSGRRPSRSSRYSSLPASVPANTYPASTTTSASAARVLDVADKYIGVPYVAGGTTPLGFDASGFTQFVFARRGVQLPRTSREQANVGLAVAPEWRAVAPGDLVMFADRDQIDHVAIYAGHNRIIHASSTLGVHYDDLSTDRGEWFVDHMVAARRVLWKSVGN